MFLFVCLCIKVYVLCMFVYFRTYHSMQIFIKLGMADKIADIDNSINAISTKVNDVDSSSDKNINSFSYTKNE